MAQLLSINIGKPEIIEVGGKPVKTGLLKQPYQGTVSISADGIDADFIGNHSVHGGPDQALYLYSKEDSDWWETQLGRPLAPGFFGENLTIDRWWPEVRIGDRIRFQDVLLEISFPRIPCATFASRIDGAAFLKAFLNAGRPGFYARVIQAGVLTAPCSGQVSRAAESNPTGVALYSLWNQKDKSKALLQAALQAPISARSRETMEIWLKKF